MCVCVCIYIYILVYSWLRNTIFCSQTKTITSEPWSPARGFGLVVRGPLLINACMESCRDSIPYSVHSSTAWVPSNHVASFFSGSITMLHFRPTTDIPSACRTHTVRRPSACSALLFAAYADSSTSVAAGAGLAPILDLPPIHALATPPFMR